MSLDVQAKQQTTPTDTSRTLRNLIDDFNGRGAHPALISFRAKSSDTVSYGALLQTIRRTALGLIARGLKKGDSVVLFAPNSPAWVQMCLSVIYFGGLAVPMDSQQTDEVLAHIVKDSKAKFICTDAKGAERVKKVFKKGGPEVILLDDGDAENSWKKLGAAPADSASSVTYLEQQALPAMAPGDFTLLFYTSGTTGMPKGAPLTHANILMQLDSVISKLDLLRPMDRVLLPLPLFHVYPLNNGLFSPLIMGLPIIMPRSLTGPEIKRAINEGKVTVIIAVPRLIRSLYQAIEKKFYAHKAVGVIFDSLLGTCGWLDNRCHIRLGKIIFAPVHKQLGPTLRMFTSGGAPIEPQLAAKIKGLGFDLACGYGLTETSPLLALRMPDNSDLEGAGEAIPGVELRIVPQKDAEKEAKHGEGEVQARGPNVFGGYLNLPDKTKEAFSEDGWFRTGDLGYFKGKQLHIVGRASSTIVMEGGEKIQPDDIEKKLSKLDGIKEIALLQKDHKLVALVVPDSKAAGKNNRDAIAALLKESARGVASYLTITDFALTSEDLPRTNLGKTKRFELEEIYDKAKAGQKSGGDAAGGGKNSTDDDKAGSDKASAEDEALLQEAPAQKCMDWLKSRYPDHKIKFDTNPALDLGIDSLEWMNLTLELLEQTGVELTEDAIARVTTVRDLLSEVNQAGEGGSGEDGKLSPIEDPEEYVSDQQKMYVEPLSPRQFKEARWLYKLCTKLMEPFEVEAIGLENLPEGQFVLTPNHASYIDAFAVVAAIPYARLQKTQWAGWVGIAYANPIFSYLSRLGQVIPIDAKNSLLTSLAMASLALKNGKNLVWFPEGERTLDGKLLPFKAGIGMLLQKSDVPIVPVYLEGTAEALPAGRYWPIKHKIRVFFGKPVLAQELAREGKKLAAAKEKTEAEQTTMALQARVQALIDQAQAEAK